MEARKKFSSQALDLTGYTCRELAPISLLPPNHTEYSSCRSMANTARVHTEAALFPDYRYPHLGMRLGERFTTGRRYQTNINGHCIYTLSSVEDYCNT